MSGYIAPGYSTRSWRGSAPNAAGNRCPDQARNTPFYGLFTFLKPGTRLLGGFRTRNLVMVFGSRNPQLLFPQPEELAAVTDRERDFVAAFERAYGRAGFRPVVRSYTTGGLQHITTGGLRPGKDDICPLANQAQRDWPHSDVIDDLLLRAVAGIGNVMRYNRMVADAQRREQEPVAIAHLRRVGPGDVRR